MSRARENRVRWNEMSEWYQETHDPHIGSRPRLWGSWAVPDDEVGALADVTGLDVLELGCGGGQWAGALVDEAASLVGLDVSERQLGFARARCPSLALVQADAEELPFVDASFDLVFCDHGAMSWGDPSRTVPEAARVLKRGGRLVFNTPSPWLRVCSDDDRDVVDDRLHHSYFDLGLLEEGGGAATYTLPYGEWVRHFRRHGLVVEDLIEIRPGPGSRSTYFATDPPDWPHRWPAEMLWVTTRE